MRAFFGTIAIFSLMVVFTVLLFFTVEESARVQSVDDVLAEEVDIDEIAVASNSYLYDRDGNVFAERRNDEHRIYLAYEELPSQFMDSFLSTEDRYFFEHEGIDMSAVGRAFFVNLQAQGIEQGASTITQQLVRNIYLDNEQTYNRKLSEILYAYEIEQQYEKEEILEMYLNTVYFHNGAYGIEAASQMYFGRAASELSLAEIAFLTGIPANPSYYDPLTNKENTHARQEWVLQKMEETEAISAEERAAALEEDIILNYNASAQDDYPAYSDYVEHEVYEFIAKEQGYREQLENAEEEERTRIEEELNQEVQSLFKQGVHIETGLEPHVQEQAEQTVNQQLSGQNLQGVSVVIDHHRNWLSAITGGVNYEKQHFHRGHQAYRQPGSAIKPLLTFAPYLDIQGSPLQSAVNADNLCRDQYCPRNVSGREYGQVSLEEAFKYSHNTAAIRLVERIGLEEAFNYLEPFSFSRTVPEDERLPAVLGGFSNGMSPFEMTDAYTTFSNDGQYQPSYAVTRILDREGEVLYEREYQPESVWSSSVNEQMRSLMTSAIREGTGTAANYTDADIGGKTGTTNNYNDLWFVGYNENYTSGVWVGNDTPASLRNHDAYHLLIWRTLMERI
ncbi:transglycosylase domain-containing protein [Salsuginibacillus kocurii]|uniref:transglycosylase domain-containing protein n=1 Tax=Salsuginibacillus kocurii TaxID=427078 RepID=UPI00036CCB99|nr:transglycosylase domain-containing protein [Salsuginibacillus kocurii]